MYRDKNIPSPWTSISIKRSHHHSEALVMHYLDKACIVKVSQRVSTEICKFMEMHVAILINRETKEYLAMWGSGIWIGRVSSCSVVRVLHPRAPKR